MTRLRPIDPKPILNRVGKIDSDLGAAPDLQWIAIARLGVDETYQRRIEKVGAQNAARIAREFDWSKFAPVIVAPVEGGFFAIIDGQHRVTAAAARGIESVPCQVVVADRAKQADAFAAINGIVTAITPMQLHTARLAAGDVSICRYPVPANKMKTGETLAAAQMQRFLTRYGREVFVTALRCITRTRKGNPGMVRAPVVSALCTILDAEPAFRADEKKLLMVMQRFDYYAAFQEAAKRAYAERCGMAAILVELLGEHFDANAGVLAA